MSSIETAYNSLKENSANAEIAFFGGSFTAIDREYMLSLLEATTDYIDKFKGIRISTRPDCIDDEVLSILKRHNVTSIELGAQSMCDDVLYANDRGHTAGDVYTASALIKSYGFSLGLQMMTGLYKSDVDTDIDTAKQFIEINPDTVRIYPTVILKNTKLEKLYNCGDYVPQDLDTAVDLGSRLLCMFNSSGIKVIRLGLHHSESLDENRVAGVYHPAFRELCESKIMLDKLLDLLKGKDKNIEHIVLVSGNSVSKLVGNRKSNLARLNELGYNIKIQQSDDVKPMDVALKTQEG